MRQRIDITGIVQGVGFRPHVYRLALDFNLVGFVFNDAKGVTIELQGEQHLIEAFLANLKASPPPLARIDTLCNEAIKKIDGDTSFVIKKTKAQVSASVMVSSDKSMCSDCRDDIHNPNSRFFNYPFTNCTNCGPRYTIIDTLPYDRKNTSMATFKMCPMCQSAYNDPLNRRYHAQPISCPECGPNITFTTNTGAELANKTYDVLKQAVNKLKAGHILAVKGLGGFHLICDATNKDAVAMLRSRKNRPTKPLAVMIPNLNFAHDIAKGEDVEWQMLDSIDRPIVLLLKKPGPNILADNIAPNLDKIGLFLPYTPLHYLLLDKFLLPIVATSANISGEPIIKDIKSLIDKLGHVVDFIVDNNRDIINSCDDSVIQFNQRVQTLRSARGYAPVSLKLDLPLNQNILAVGAQQKNTIALGFKNNVIVSAHIGDLFSVNACEYFIRTLETFKRLYDFKPDLIVCDLHPNYATTDWAKDYSKQHNLPLIQVQHHYSHILSVMAQHNYTHPVLGFAFDGTGFGVDNTLWGGEVLIADVHDFIRQMHLKTFKLIGGEKAILEPKRIMLALLFEIYSLDEVLNLKIKAIQNLSPVEIKNLHKIWQTPCVLCSSIGRLFDGIAFMLGLVTNISFEGEAGMLIENYASNEAATSLYLTIDDSLINWSLLITDIIKHLNHNTPTCDIAKGFMLSIVDLIINISNSMPELKVVLAGGVFQNKFINTKSLEALGSRALITKEIPINDGGISLGQLWYAKHYK